MRGLPPLPPDFLSITAEWNCDAARFTNTWHLFCPGSSAAEPSDLSSLISQWFLLCLPDLLAVLPTAASCDTCRAASSGPFGSVLEEPLADNHGGFGSITPIRSALVLTWSTASGPDASRSHSYLPLVSEFIDDDLAHLRAISYAEAGSAARSYALHMNELTLAGFGDCTFAVVSRSTGGAPRPSSTWAPVTNGTASPRLGAIRRRGL